MKIIGIILLAIFTIFTGFVVIECAAADMTGQPPQQIIEMYNVIQGLIPKQLPPQLPVRWDSHQG